MLEPGVGVTVETRYEIERVDLNYFVEDDGSPANGA
jgi:hypothetical protein